MSEKQIIERQRETNERLKAEREEMLTLYREVDAERNRLAKELNELKGYVHRHETTSCDKFLFEERDRVIAELRAQAVKRNTEWAKAVRSLGADKAKLEIAVQDLRTQVQTLQSAISNITNREKEE